MRGIGTLRELEKAWNELKEELYAVLKLQRGKIGQVHGPHSRGTYV
jgi:hypothetical protein